MEFILFPMSGFDLHSTAITVCVLCVIITSIISCLWIKRNRRPKRRQSKIDMEYAVKFSYPRRLTNSETVNGDHTVTDKSSGVVSITQCTPKAEPRPKSMAPSRPASRPPHTYSGSQVRESVVLVHNHDLNQEEKGQRETEVRQGDGDEQGQVAVVAETTMTTEKTIEAGHPEIEHQLSTESHGPTAPIPVPVDRFVEHVKGMKEENSAFDDEWARLFDHRYMSQSFATLEPNFKKNRYKNILPYDHARVILDRIDGDPYSDYVNASYIHSFTQEKTYIASQGPNVTSISDFWRMIWQEKVETIVMATHLIDKGKIKCEKYWPDPGEELFFEDIVVTCEAEIHGVHDARRTLLIHKGEEVRCADHFHFTRWPDKGVPRNVSVLLRFIKDVNDSRDHKTTPLLVHCSAGVGRTGVVIALDNEIERAKQTGFVDIFGFIREMRQCRPQMVQTPEQYEFIHDAMLEYLLGHDTMIPRDQFIDHLTALQTKIDLDATMTKLDQEYEILNKVCHEPPQDAINVGKLEENASKNRYQNVLPRDTHRPLLMTFSTDSSTQYINATFCQGYKDRERIITTQMPLPGTVTDFLRLLYDYRISTIVMLNDVLDEDAASTYWEDGNPNIQPPFSVSVLDRVDSEHWTERTLQLKHRKNTRIIQHFHFVSWKDVNSVVFYQTLLDFMNNVTSQQGGDSPVLVHCLNGVGRTGVFCVVKMCLDQLEVEDSIDVFQTVKALRHDNYQMVQSLEDYELCYRILNHLMTMSQEEVTLGSVQDEFDVENTEFLSETVSTKTCDDDNDEDDGEEEMREEEEEEEDDVEIDPVEYYAHDDDDGIDEEDDQDCKEGLNEVGEPFMNDLDLRDFNDMTITKL